MKRAVIMTRVSSEEQAKGFSLGVQFEQLTNYCKRKDIEVVAHYKEDHSAKNFNRPEFQNFLRFAKKNKKTIDYLLVTTWDRFSRNVTDSFLMIRQLKEMGIEVQAIEQPIDFSIPESKAMLAINLVFPEIDNDRRSIKIRGGIRGSLKAGRYCRKAPMGYANKRDVNNRPIIQPSPKAKFIQYAFKAIVQGKSQVTIRLELLSKGFKVSRNNLSKLLTNPVYMGKIIVPKEGQEQERLIEGIHQGIISEKLFYQVQEKLTERQQSRNKPRYNTLREELPLRGKLHCTKCQSKMTGSPSRSSNGNKYYYYHCSHCKKERFPAIKVNTTFESILEDFQFTKQSKVLYKEILKSLTGVNQKDRLRKRKKLNKELESLNSRIENLQDLLVDGTISPKTYGQTLNRYSKQTDQITSSLNGLNTTDSEYKGLIENAFKHLENFRQSYVNSSIEDKTKLISSIFPEKIEFDGIKCRTPRINDVLRYILQIDKELPVNKKGQISKNLSLSPLVVSVRIEPSSKRVLLQPSTCLVFV